MWRTTTERTDLQHSRQVVSSTDKNPDDEQKVKVRWVRVICLDGAQSNLNDSSEFVRDDKRDLYPICFIRK